MSSRFVRLTACALAVVLGLCLSIYSEYRARKERRSDTLFRPSAFHPPATFAPATERAAGCGTARPSPVGSETTIGDRSFLAWGPADYDASRAYPIVVVFHGWHTDAKSFASWFEMQKYVGGGAFVIYPNGQNKLWDVSGARDTDFVAAIVDSVAATYCVDRGRVLGFGFSFGGKMAYHLGCRRPDLVKAIAVGDGSMGGPEQGCGTVPLLATHRSVDEDEKFAWGADAFAAWSKQSGCGTDSDIVDDVHACRTMRSCRAPATFCQDDYVNPAWPDTWNHTVRNEYRALTWEWFASLP